MSEHPAAERARFLHERLLLAGLGDRKVSRKDLETVAAAYFDVSLGTAWNVVAAGEPLGLWEPLSRRGGKGALVRVHALPKLQEHPIQDGDGLRGDSTLGLLT